MAAIDDARPPSHPGLFQVAYKPGSFLSGCESRKTFRAGEVIVHLGRVSKGVKAFNTLQCGPGSEDHIHLNSDLIFVNHSCDPNSAFDLSSANPSEWQIRALRDITVGEQLTAFYPATEWDMGQPFDCNCAFKGCLQRVEGASGLQAEVLSRYWLNPWIVRLIREQGQTSRKDSVHT